jgi:hypothetical protein
MVYLVDNGITDTSFGHLGFLLKQFITSSQCQLFLLIKIISGYQSIIGEHCNGYIKRLGVKSEQKCWKKIPGNIILEF